MRVAKLSFFGFKYGMLKKIKNCQKKWNVFVGWWPPLYICSRLFVNLSAFVLAGSHLVLTSTKAESIQEAEVYPLIFL